MTEFLAVDVPVQDRPCLLNPLCLYNSGQTFDCALRAPSFNLDVRSFFLSVHVDEIPQPLPAVRFGVIKRSCVFLKNAKSSQMCAPSFLANIYDSHATLLRYVGYGHPRAMPIANMCAVEIM